MRVSVGDKVRTPTGNKATVKSLEQVQKPGHRRIRLLATVQERNSKGHLLGSPVQYKPSQLRPVVS